MRTLRPLGLALLLALTVEAAPTRITTRCPPRNISIEIVPSAFDGRYVPTGNVKVTFAHGRNELLTTTGDCLDAKISRRGDVGWRRVDKSAHARDRPGADAGRKDPKKNAVVVRLPDGTTKEFVGSEEMPFVGGWAFLEAGKVVALKSMGFHGPYSFFKYDVRTGRLLDSIEVYQPFKRRPNWAKRISKEDADDPND